jgi:hypothetical protein
MKDGRRLYWIVTGLMAVFMLMASIPDILRIPQAVDLFRHLGYPTYLLPFWASRKRWASSPSWLQVFSGSRSGRTRD